MDTVVAALGPLLLALAASGGIAVAHHRGFRPRRVMLGVLGVVLGGGSGALPGAWLWIGRAIRSATGPGGGGPLSWEAITALVLLGVAIGGGVGLSVVEGRASATPRWIAFAASLFGTVVSAGVYCVALVLAQGRLEIAVFALGPLAFGGMALGCYAVLAAFRDPGT